MFSRPYVFIKPTQHFGNRIKATVPDQQPHHSITKIFKNLKENSSPNRSKHPWINIENSGYEKKHEERLIKMAILAGEIQSFLDPIYFVKTRGLHDEQINKFTILSKEIINGMDFFDYFEKKIKGPKQFIRQNGKWEYVGKDFKEGLARSDMFSLLFQESDYHFGNLYVNEKEYCKRIDFNRSFSCITNKLHKIQFQIDKYPLLTADSYHNLPVIDKKLENTKKHWQHSKGDEHAASLIYAKPLSKSEEYLNEKYFYSFKFLINSSYLNHLISVHIDDPTDHKETKELIKEVSDVFLQICKDSPSFSHYFNTNQKQAMKAIFFEVNEFLVTNKHYTSKDPSIAEKNWDTIIQNMLSEYSKLLKNIGKEELTPSELDDLTKIAKKIKSNDPNTMNEVKAFYESQKMSHYAELTTKYIKPEFTKEAKNIDGPAIIQPVITSPGLKKQKVEPFSVSSYSLLKPLETVNKNSSFLSPDSYDTSKVLKSS